MSEGPRSNVDGFLADRATGRQTSTSTKYGLPQWTQEPGRVAVVHDWVTGMRGGEAILDAIFELFPKADLLTLFQTDYVMNQRILGPRRVIHSPLQFFMRWRFFRERYRYLLPLFPWAAERLDLNKYDLVISNTHCVAKGVKPRAGVPHVSFVSTPMRYVWDLFDDYFGQGRAGFVTRVAAKILRRPLQHWDVRSTERVNRLAANSEFVAERVRNFWHRSDVVVVHPFVDLARFTPLSDAERAAVPENKRYFLVVSAFAPNKRIDLAIQAFRELGLNLKIVGGGQEAGPLEELARGSANIEFLGSRSNSEIADLYAGAEALIFPGLEDFGITPLESMASGRPVIGYGRGGLLDTVTPETGLLFSEQSVAALVEAVRGFQKMPGKFSAEACRRRAEEFSRERFARDFSKLALEAIRS